jgi:peptide deformylase
VALLKIARMGHPILRDPATPVEDPGAPGIRRLVADMIETMYDADGTGLAAPQVYVPKRIVVFFVSGPRAALEEESDQEPDPREGPVPLTVLINPEIEPLTDETALGWEGCLSVPDMIGAVPRCTKIRYRGVTPDGERIDRIAHGFHARVVQHECDHLDGVLYPMRVPDMTLFGFAKEMELMMAAQRELDRDRTAAAMADAATAAEAS